MGLGPVMGACCGWWDGSGSVPDDDDDMPVALAVLAIVPVVVVVAAMACRVLGVWIGLDRNRFWRGDAGPPDRVGEVTITAAFSLDKDGLRFFGGAICELTILAKSDNGWSPFFLPLSVDSSCDFAVTTMLLCRSVVAMVDSSSSSSSSLETAGVAGISSEALVSGFFNIEVLVVVVVSEVVVFPVAVVFLGDPKSDVVVADRLVNVVFSSSFMAFSSLLVLLVISASSSSSCSASSISSSSLSSLSLPWSSTCSSSPLLVGVVPVGLVVEVVVGPTTTTLA
jgi:hypothetical protein